MSLVVRFLHRHEELGHEFRRVRIGSHLSSASANAAELEDRLKPIEVVRQIGQGELKGLIGDVLDNPELLEVRGDQNRRSIPRIE